MPIRFQDDLRPVAPCRAVRLSGREPLFLITDDLAISRIGSRRAAIEFSLPTTVYLNVFWEEGGRNVGIYKDAQCIGNVGHTHGWGYEGGEAVTANDQHLFIAQHVNNEGGGLKSPNTWPPKGKGRAGVSRRFRGGKPAPFAGGKGGDGDTLKGCFLPMNEFDEKAPVAITGMAATNERLCIADASGRIRTFDPNTMVKTDEFNAPGARQLTFEPDGTLWVIQGGGATAPAKIVHYTASGELLPQTISGIAAPTALACDTKKRLF